MLNKVIMLISMIIPHAAQKHVSVTRSSQDVYVVDGNENDPTVFITVGCTQTASRMNSHVVRAQGRHHLVFVDRNGEEEADCELIAVIRGNE